MNDCTPDTLVLVVVVVVAVVVVVVVVVMVVVVVVIGMPAFLMRLSISITLGCAAWHLQRWQPHTALCVVARTCFRRVVISCLELLRSHWQPCDIGAGYLFGKESTVSSIKHLGPCCACNGDRILFEKALVPLEHHRVQRLCAALMIAGTHM
jgi:hypothetical protein